MSERETTRYRICPLCEATCGLELQTEGRVVTAIRGDAEDVFSLGFMCPKGAALKELDADPDRLREPLVRRDGRLVPVGWDEAFAEIERRLIPILEEYGKDSLATYLGNPSVHNADLAIYYQVLATVLPSRNRFTASTVDQIPKHVSCGLMFGGYLSIPVPDIDRCDYLLMLGANPMVSNGSLFTAPDFRGRVRAMHGRGGRLIVVDPRRTETARLADRHVFIRPGTDAYLLIGMARTLFEEGLVKPGRLEAHLNGLAELERAVESFPAERVAPVCGIAAERIRELARELAGARAGAVYGRIGTCTQAFGTLTSWLVDVLNVLTGNLDRPGGAMFPKAAAFASNTEGKPGRGSGVRLGRRHSRVRGAPEIMGEFPVACLAEEIETEGEGRIRALITIAGNPALSTPDSEGLERALGKLDFMVSLDLYLNETTRHADVILPAPSPLETSHFDVAFPQLAVRNQARYSPAVFDMGDRPAEWESILHLVGIVTGQGAAANLRALDDLAIRLQLQKEVEDSSSPLHGRDVEELFSALASRRGPERMIDFALRKGPYGDAFGARPGGLSLAELEANPHGVDLGPLEERIPEVLRTPSGKIELAPEYILGDLARLEVRLKPPEEGEMLLVGRRHLRSNNSWLHNLPKLATGRARCTLELNPADAERLGLLDGALARVRSRTGEIEIPVEISDTIMPGVVSAPHGWGHNQPGAKLGVASARPGVNSNRLANVDDLDPLSGNAVLNGISVTVESL